MSNAQEQFEADFGELRQPNIVRIYRTNPTDADQQILEAIKIHRPSGTFEITEDVWAHMLSAANNAQYVLTSED